MRFGKSLALLLFTLSFVTTLVAQEGGQQDENLLPDIDPQDIEIRSDYKPRFPGLRRQPILGFDPQPRVYQLDPNRMPFLETRDEVVAAVPISTLQVPGAPRRQRMTFPERSSVYLRTGFGMLMTPDFQVALNEPSRNTRFIANMRFLSSDGGDFAYPTQFRNADGYLGFVHSNDGVRSTFLVTGLEDMNRQPVATDSTIAKITHQYGVRFNRSRVKNAFDYSDVTIDYDWFNQDTNQDFFSHNLTLGIIKAFPGSQLNSKWVWTLDGKGSLYDRGSLTSLPENEHWYIATTGIAYDWRIDYDRAFRLGFDVNYARDEQNEGLFIYPDIRFTYWGLKDWTFKFGIDGQVRNRGMMGWYQVNRFLFPTGPVENDRGVRVYLNTSYQMNERNELLGGFAVNRYTNFGFVSDQPTGTPLYMNVAVADQVTNILNYDQAQITRFYGGYALHSKPSKVTWRTELYYQQSITERVPNLPYLAQFGVESTLMAYITDKWSTQIGADLAFGRETNVASENYMVLNLETSYQISQNFSIYAKALNLFNQTYQYWAGHNEVPLLVLGGLTFNF